MRELLYFSGTRWGGAKVVARKQVVDDDPDHRGRKVPLVDTLIIETTGVGRPYLVDHVEGWWRDLAEFRLDDERRVLSFLQRRGDPFGKLKSDGTQISTYDWRDLKRVLERAAQGWAEELSVSYHGGITPIYRAKILAAYLCAAAAASVRGGLDMRRCDYCSSWFTLHYANARQCSASCRAARFNKRTSPHGVVSQD